MHNIEVTNWLPYLILFDFNLSELVDSIVHAYFLNFYI